MKNKIRYSHIKPDIQNTTRTYYISEPQVRESKVATNTSAGEFRYAIISIYYPKMKLSDDEVIKGYNKIIN